MDPRSRLLALVGGLPRPFWVLWVGTFVNRLGGFVLPFLAVYLTRERGLSPTQAGTVVALYGAGATLAGLLGGTLADRIGRRATMLIALWGGGAGLIAIGFADRMAVIAPAIFVVALVSETYRPGMQAAIADLVPADQRVRAFGLIYWVINLGFALGLSLGGWLADHSFRGLFVANGLTMILFGTLVARGVPETRPALAAPPAVRATGPGFLVPFRDRTFLAFVGLTFVNAMVFMQSGAAFSLDMASNGLGSATFGSILAINGVLIVVIQPFLGPFLTRFDRSRTLATGSLLYAIGFGMYAFVHDAWGFAAGVIVWTIGEVCVLPVSNAVVADLAPPDRRGRYQGANSLAFGLAVALGPLFGLWLFEHAGRATLWLIMFALGLVGTIGHLALAPRLRRLRAERMAA